MCAAMDIVSSLESADKFSILMNRKFKAFTVRPL